MSADATRLWIRPLHIWFHAFEDIVPSMHRVVAVVVGATTTVVLVEIATRARLILTAPLAVVMWVGLSIAQERDDRRTRPVDAEFLHLLHRDIDPLMQGSGFRFTAASGARYSRSNREETFLYETMTADGRDCVDLWIRRTPGLSMDVTIDGQRLSNQMHAVGDSDLAHRITLSTNPPEDVAVLAAALSRVL